ncbi:Methionyl-tRNA synthetase [Klebsormidium nitens]|uniref:methionine--tRNA ligase n=1 Tax=Klebsormidium nitens TaxID=105231 RepID=A0A1Y1IF40_KLENI|nr:Methionyl-tRNA synthetase [Klebsormidium nitens]|eukprot:GAQ88612.1 Methionyl-tRNA synthetase [Klebsormidium nitens]
MGSAYPTFAADALARFQRLQGKKVTFITGTDEHGEKIATSAAAAGKEPKEFVDSIAEEFKSLWHDLDISYDSFIRTTNDNHEKIVAETIQRVWDKGDIYRAEYEGLYCVACEEYKDEKDLIGTEVDGSGEKIVCPTHRKPCQHRQEDNFFFKLSNYQSDIERLFETNPDFVRPTFRKNEVLEWVKDGVRDFSISRAAVEWGIRIPADPKQTVYVWFDALLGYVSALLKEGVEPTLENAVAQGWPASVHIIGKDILRFHAVYWPGMLLSAGLPLPRSVFGHGFLTKDGLKMGKSLGNVIEPTALVKQYGSDAVRYFFLKEVEFGKDGDFSEERFINIVNANLANAIGNLLNRTLGLLKKNCGGALTADASSLPEDHPLRLVTKNAVQKAAEEYTNLQFGAAGEAALSIAVAGNEYIDTVAPWSQFKKGDAEKAQAALDLLAILEASRILAITLSPIAPRVTQRIYLQLGYSEDDWKAVTWADTAWGKLKAGQQMAEPKPVFVRLEAPGSADEAPTPKPKPAKAQKKQKSEKKPAAVPS